MKNLFCSVCKKNAEYEKITQLNTINYYCKNCIIEKRGASELGGTNVKCDRCGQPSNYIIMKQDNRVKNCCVNCLLRNYQKL